MVRCRRAVWVVWVVRPAEVVQAEATVAVSPAMGGICCKGRQVRSVGALGGPINGPFHWALLVPTALTSQCSALRGME